MDKLIELRKKEEEASNAFMYAKSGSNLQELYKAELEARKKRREHETWLYKGSGVNGNEI